MTVLKYFILIFVALQISACTLLYSGDGKYIVDRYYFILASYSIEFPEVPLDKKGVYVYNFDNYYSSNENKRLELDITGDSYIVPTILSTNLKVAVFNKNGELVAFIDSPLNKRELSMFGEYAYPDMSWWGRCSGGFNSKDYDDREMIAKFPENVQYINDYKDKLKIKKCTFIPDYSTESQYYSGWDGNRVNSFRSYKVVLTVYKPNSSLKNINGRLTLRSGWK